jgi:hypothetical protein
VAVSKNVTKCEANLNSSPQLVASIIRPSSLSLTRTHTHTHTKRENYRTIREAFLLIARRYANSKERGARKKKKNTFQKFSLFIFSS